MKYLILISLLLFLSGCATSMGITAVENRASFDLNCVEISKVEVISTGSYAARGCGKLATYTTNRCWAIDLESCKATLERVTQYK